MTYWLVNSGSSDDPLSTRHGAVRATFEDWDQQQGEVHGLDRSYGMEPGDVLIYRSVGTPISHLVAYAEVLSPPVERPFLRWKYQVERRTLGVVDTLRNGPRFDELGIGPVRMTRRLDDEVGERAVELIRAAVENPRTR